MKFIPPRNVKIATIIDILTFISRNMAVFGDLNMKMTLVLSLLTFMRTAVEISRLAELGIKQVYNPEARLRSCLYRNCYPFLNTTFNFVCASRFAYWD